MVVPIQTARRLTRARHAPNHRQIRIRFESRAALLDGFALAQKESWIEDCHVDLPQRELVIRMAGGFSIHPARAAAVRRPRPGATTSGGQV